MSEERWYSPDGGPAVSPSETTDTLSIQFRRAALERHLAFFYDSPEWQLQVAATFIAAGLERGHRCLYFVDSNTRQSIERALRDIGVDVDARLDAGDLVIQAGSEAYRVADFEPDALITQLEDAARDSVEDGYDGLWVAGEVSWCFHTDLDYDHVVDFEAAFDAAAADIPVTSLCQYDLAQFCETSVAKAFWTHKQIIYRDRLCENPFYLAPDEYRSTADPSVNARLMLEQTYRLTGTTEQLERREQRLDVVDRVLRHDIRNHLNITKGLINYVRDAATLDDDHLSKLSTAADYVDSVVETATKARFVQQTLGASSIQQQSLGVLFDRAVEQVASDYPEATLRIDGDTGITVVADRTFDIALAELLRYVLDTQDPPGQVSLNVVEHAPDRVSLEVSHPGPPLPENDRQVIQEGQETPLSHCTGMGLWLVKWTVENGDGGIELPSSAENPLRISLKRPLSRH